MAEHVEVREPQWPRPAIDAVGAGRLQAPPGGDATPAGRRAERPPRSPAGAAPGGRARSSTYTHNVDPSAPAPAGAANETRRSAQPRPVPLHHVVSSTSSPSNGEPLDGQHRAAHDPGVARLVEPRVEGVVAGEVLEVPGEGIQAQTAAGRHVAQPDTPLTAEDATRGGAWDQVVHECPQISDGKCN